MDARGSFIDDSGRMLNGEAFEREVSRISSELRSVGWNSGQSAILVASATLDFVATLVATTRLGLHLIFAGTRTLNEISLEHGDRVHGVLKPGLAFSGPRMVQTPFLDRSGPTFHLFTSGTTGAPKLVALDFETMLERAKLECEIFGIQADTTVLNVMHPSYELGLNQIFSTLLSGANLAFASSPIPEAVVERLESSRADGIIATPQFWTNLVSRLDPPRVIRHSLEWLSISGGRVSQKDFDSIRSLFPTAAIFHTYGKTETGRSLYGLCESELVLDRVPSGIDVRIENGELVHSGRTLGFSATGDAILEHRTGDLFTIDADGRYTFEGRRDNLVKYLDLRVNLEEIESCLTQHPNVAQAICRIEETTAKWEGSQALVALVELRRPTQASELRAFLLNRLSAHKIPRSFRHVTSWPLTRSFKIDRKALSSWNDCTELT